MYICSVTHAGRTKFIVHRSSLLIVRWRLHPPLRKKINLEFTLQSARGVNLHPPSDLVSQASKEQRAILVPSLEVRSSIFAVRGRPDLQDDRTASERTPFVLAWCSGDTAAQRYHHKNACLVRHGSNVKKVP